MLSLSETTPKRSGFSTIELLVASAVLIVLGAVGAVVYTGYIERVRSDLSDH